MNNTIKIEGGIPIPSKGAGAGARWPNRPIFSGMEVGDSVFFAGRSTASVSSTASYTAKTLGYRFTCRAVTENGVKGARIWRVA